MLVRRADNLTTFMCRLSRNLVTSTSCIEIVLRLPYWIQNGQIHAMANLLSGELGRSLPGHQKLCKR